MNPLCVCVALLAAPVRAACLFVKVVARIVTTNVANLGVVLDCSAANPSDYALAEWAGRAYCRDGSG